MSSFQVDIASFGLAAEVPILGAYLYARQMRFQTHERWKARASVAKVALNERSVDAVLALQQLVEGALDGIIDSQALGSSAIDPGLFTADVTRFQKYQQQRASIDRRYSRMKALCPWIAHALLVLVVTLPTMTIGFAWEGAERYFRYTWILVGVAALAVLAIITLGAVFLGARDGLAKSVMTGAGDEK